MAQKRCRTCFLTIHDTVQKCPHCGDPKPHKEKFEFHTIHLVLFVVVVAIFVLWDDISWVRY